MARSTPRFLALSAVAIAGLVSACAPGDGASPPFPIIGDDPGDLVETMEWGESPALDQFPPTAKTVLEVLASSTPEVLRIAVEGGVCPPSAQVQVTGNPEAVVIELILGGSISPPGLECGEALTTHELIIRFRQPVDLDTLQLSARRTGEPAG